jgi:hypothetical protein
MQLSATKGHVQSAVSDAREQIFPRLCPWGGPFIQVPVLEEDPGDFAKLRAVEQDSRVVRI